MDNVSTEIENNIKSKLPDMDIRCSLFKDGEDTFLRTEIGNWNSFRKLKIVPTKGNTALVETCSGIEVCRYLMAKINKK